MIFISLSSTSPPIPSSVSPHSFPFFFLLFYFLPPLLSSSFSLTRLFLLHLPLSSSPLLFVLLSTLPLSFPHSPPHFLLLLPLVFPFFSLSLFFRSLSRTLQTDHGIKNLSVDRAAYLSGVDSDYSLKDLYEAIANRNFVSVLCTAHMYRQFP